MLFKREKKSLFILGTVETCRSAAGRRKVSSALKEMTHTVTVSEADCRYT
jgi:hypothetical protein